MLRYTTEVSNDSNECRQAELANILNFYVGLMESNGSLANFSSPPGRSIGTNKHLK